MLTEDTNSYDDVKAASELAKKYDFDDPDSRKKAYDATVKKYGDVEGDYMYYRALNIADAKNWVDTNDYLKVEQSLGLATGVKTKVIKELQKQGYNAMYDNASIGVKGDGSYNKAQEGIEPLIIFDSKNTLKETAVNKVDKSSQLDSGDRYINWQSERDKVLRDFQ